MTNIASIPIRISYALAFCMISSFSAAEADDYWKATNGVAHTTISLPKAKKPNTSATLTIEYSIVAGKCRVMVGVAVLSGGSYGTAIDSRKIEDLMTVTILGKHRWSAKPVVALYSNGLEAAIPASDEFIAELKSGKTVHVHPMPSLPIFEFSLNGSSAAISTASAACR